MQKLDIENNKLLWGGKIVEDLAEKYSTPLFLYDEKMLSSCIKELKKGPWEIHYAVKANPSPELLKTILRHDIGIDAVSANEVSYVISLGFDPKKIVYTSSSLSEDETKKITEKGVLVNLNSVEEMEIYGKVAPNTNIGIRINPEIKAGHHRNVETATEISKFGILINDVKKALVTSKKYNLKITMVHFHIGSGILDAKLFVAAFENVLEIIADIGFSDLTHINLGGGIGTPYRPGEERLDLDFLIKEVGRLHNGFTERYKKQTKLIIEPGRYLVNECGILVANINTVSINNYRTFYRIDSGFNHLLRPSMYGSYHHFVNASAVDGEKEEIILSGNICESGDVLNSKPRKITKAKKDDKVAILDSGAYGVAMGMEIYNLRGLPAEIMLKEDGEEILFADHQQLDNILSRYKHEVLSVQ